MFPVGCRISPLSNLCFLPLKIESFLSEHSSIFAEEVISRVLSQSLAIVMFLGETI